LLASVFLSLFRFYFLFSPFRRQGSSVRIVTRLRTGRSGIDSCQGHGIFLFATAYRPSLGSTQPSIQWVLGSLSAGVKRPAREADRSPTSSAGVKNVWSYASASQYIVMAWCLVKHRNNFAFLSGFISVRFLYEIKHRSKSGKQSKNEGVCKARVAHVKHTFLASCSFSEGCGHFYADTDFPLHEYFTLAPIQQFMQL
jgi:hypothetical protein